MKENRDSIEINRDSIETEIDETSRDSLRLVETIKTETHGDSWRLMETQSTNLNQSQSVSVSQSQQVSLSLCMIVKNEELNIGRSLESVQPLVDEMIVVDTGSTDRTKDIAKELGAKVYDFAWTDSFADARNFALSKATSDWILILDADEVISASDHEALKKLITDSKDETNRDSSRLVETEKTETHRDSSRLIETVKTETHEDSIETNRDSKASTSLNKSQQVSGLHQSQSVSALRTAYLFTTRNYVIPTNVAGWVANDGRYLEEEAGTGWFPGEKVRLFPNDKNLRFENPVHERIEPSLERFGIGIRQCPIPVHHYGMLDEEAIRAKHEYYYHLGKKRLAEKGRNDFRAVYDFAVQASGIGEYDEALEYFEQAIAMNPGFAKAHESLGNTYFNLKQYDNAITSYRKSLELEPSSRDAVVMCAQCEIITGQADRTIQRLEAFLKTDPAYGKTVFLLAAAYFAHGEWEKGIDYCRELRDSQTGLIGYLRDFAQLLFSQQRNLEAQRLLNAVEELKNRLD
jgi:glycosyltransferase involved in cell wall biosynthesis